MEAVISESLFEKLKSSFDMLNRNWVFILLSSNIILSLLINTIHNKKEFSPIAKNVSGQEDGLVDFSNNLIPCIKKSRKE